MNEKKKSLILTIIAVITLLTFVGGASFAYFRMQGGEDKTESLNVTTGTTDLLSFNIEKDIILNANQSNFNQGDPDVKGSTKATATLRPNNATNEASAMYNIYVIIEENDFIYTTDEGTPELLLKVTDPNGNEVQTITGLIYNGEGFDITTRTGGFLIMSDYEIDASGTTVSQDWNVEVIFKNLDSNQNANGGKTLTGKIYMTQEKKSSYELIEINSLETTTTYNSITTTLQTTSGTAEANKYYYGIEEASGTLGYESNGILRLNSILASAEDVEYIESDEATYTFSNLSANTEYKVYSYVVDKNNIKSNVYETTIKTDEYENPVIESVEHSVTLNSISLTVNATKGSNEIVKYRYSKDNGESYQESESNTYTFDNLQDTTEYKIKVKVVDSEGHESTEYYEAIATTTYVLPNITNVNATKTYNSITLTPVGVAGTNEISKYMYSINNGEYQESNVFNGLSENTKYTIKVKAIDTNNRESLEYSLEVTTNTYVVPSISNVSVSSTDKSITINVSGTNGDGTITKYYYSKDNGSNYVESTSSSYTFSNLTSGTTFYIKVYVEDNNGRESSVYSTSKATTYVNPSVTKVTTSNITTSSIRLNVTASAGSNAIQTYYYSKNNGSSYESSTSSSYTFSGLNSGTTYNFKVYVVDTKGTKSNEKTVSGTTTYVNPSVTKVTTSNITTDSITLKVTASGGTNSVATYYYSKDNGSSYVSSTSSSYTFSGLTKGTTYNFKVYVKDSAGYSSSTKSISATTDSVVYICNTGTSLATCIKSQYKSQGTNGIYYHTSSLANSAADNSYRYAGANPNNYVCFGSDAATCPNDNLYRIIGVFDNEVKLIKSTRYGYYVWDSGNDNTWSTSDIKTTLNTTYYNTLSPTWQNKIATHTWKVGGMAWSDTNTAKQYYDTEVGSSSSSTTDSMKIGLMYVSDYGFAASPDYWTTELFNYFPSKSSNWMVGLTEWTVSRNSSSSNRAFFVNSEGYVEYNGYRVTVSYAVRPSFYLSSSTTYVSGSGSSADPFRIT